MFLSDYIFALEDSIKVLYMNDTCKKIGK